jgi:predicted transcriptional regulator
MKTAVSLPDELFRRVERLAKAQKLSRSAVYRKALEAYVAGLKVDVTARIDAALAEIGDDPEHEAWTRATTAHSLRRGR